MNAAARPRSRLCPSPAESKADLNMASTGSSRGTSVHAHGNAAGVEERLRPQSAEVHWCDDGEPSASGPLPLPGHRPSSAAAAVAGKTKQAVSLAKRLSERGRPGISGSAVKRAPVVTKLPDISSARAGHDRTSKRKIAPSPRRCFDADELRACDIKGKQAHVTGGAVAHAKMEYNILQQEIDPRTSQEDSGGGSKPSNAIAAVVSPANASDAVPGEVLTFAPLQHGPSTAAGSTADAESPRQIFRHVTAPGSTVDVESARQLFRHVGIPGENPIPEKIIRLEQIGVEESGDRMQGWLPEAENGLLRGDDHGAELLIAALWNAALHHEGGSQFTYARCRDNIYDIEVLPFSSCPRLQTGVAQVWVTIAASGLTFHRCDEQGEQVDEEFVLLDNWISDRRKFLKLQELRWFKIYPIRKTFGTWRHNTVHAAQEFVANKLEKDLLLLRPKYRDALLWLQTFCQTRLPRSAIVSRHCRGRQSIAVFLQAIHAGRQEAAVRVAELDEELRVEIARACNDIFAEVLEREFQGAMPTSAVRQRSTEAENALGVPGYKLTQTHRVRIRSECQRICRLVRVSNFILGYHLQGLCRQEIYRILDAVRLPRQISSDDKEVIVFIVKVSGSRRMSAERMCTGGDPLRIGALTLESDPDTTCNALREAMDGLIETLQLFKILPCNPDFANYAEVADDVSTKRTSHKREANGDRPGEKERSFGPIQFWPGFSFDDILLSEEAIAQATKSARAIIHDAFSAAEKYLADTESYIAEFQKCRISDAKQIGEAEDPVQELDDQIRLYVKSIQHFKGLPERVRIEVLELDMTDLLMRIIDILRDGLRGFALVLPKLLAEKTQSAAAWVDDGLQLVRMTFPENVKQFVYFLKRVRKISSELSGMRHVRQQLRDVLDLADEHKLVVGKDSYANFEKFSDNFNALLAEIHEVEGVINKRVAFFVIELDSIRPRLLEKLQNLFEEVMSPNLLTLNHAQGQLEPTADPPSQVMLDSGKLTILFEDQVEEADVKSKLAWLDDLSPKFGTLSNEVSELTEQQDILYVRNNACQLLLGTANAEFATRKKLWNSLREWRKHLLRWGGVNFRQLDIGDVDKVCNHLDASLGQLPVSSISMEMQGRMKIMHVACEILHELQHAKLKDRHWLQFAEVLEIGEDEERDFQEGVPFSELVDLGLLSASTAVHELCHRAMQEEAIDAQLQMLQHKWNMIRLRTETKFRGLDDLFLANVADVIEEVDDSCVMISALATSPFVAPFIENVHEWQQQLVSMEETLEAWISFEMSWCTVRPILARGDIAAHVHDNGSFENIEMWYRQLMETIAHDSLATKALLYPGRCADIREHVATLEKMQIDLDGLMESKRRRCPRLYFVGSSDVLEMMRDEHSMVCMQPHIRKCFAGIDNVLLEVREEDLGERISNDLEKSVRDAKSDVAVAMISAQGETLYWGRVRHESKLENLLLNIEEAMVRVLRRQCWMALGSLRGGANDSTEAFLDWVLSEEYCAQANMMAGLVSWCRDVEMVFHQREGGVSMALEQHQTITLESMFSSLKTDLRPVKRLGVLAQITVNLFCRDVLEFLCAAHVSCASSFDWQRQQRWYWDVGGGEMLASASDSLEFDQKSQGAMAMPVPTQKGSSGGLGLCMKQIAFEFAYGFEYYGVTHRIVITPLTERCWLTISQAMANKYCTMLLGPPGTGKSETTKDLAKSLGTQCIVFNCGKDTDSKIARRLFSGLAQSGAWLCLDEFDCIGGDVLNVLATQILTLRCALLACMRQVDFEGQLIPLNGSLGILVILNPGLAGRQALPDNMKVLFRPAAMVTPDFEYITRVLLIMEQFKEAKAIARRLALFFELASQQLSKELHYHFGLRDLKLILALAVRMQSNDHEASEEILVVRALRTATIPSLVGNDKVLFDDLVSDIFAESSKQQAPAEPKFMDMSSKVIENQGLEMSEQLCSKALQIHETLHMQTGIILVGPPGSGKSTSLKCCAEVEHEMAAEDIPGFQEIEVKTVNHKVFHRDELYGTVSALNSQWKDGLLPHFLRSQTRHENQADPDWKVTFVIAFDGPVDPGWAEDMNTLLDDNRMLCLTSGERLHVSQNTHVLFETEDLLQASPAIVSRCGIVHFSDKDIGWQPFFTLWETKRLPELVASFANEDDLNHLKELFQKLPSALDLRQTWSKPSSASANIQVVFSFTKIFEFVLDAKPREGDIVSPGRMMNVLQGVIDDKPSKSLKGARMPKLERMRTQGNVDDEDFHSPFNTKRFLQVSFTFALTWSVGNTTSMSERSDFHRWCLRHVPNFVLPLQCHVHDVYVDWSCEPQYLRPWSADMQTVPRLDLSAFDTVKIPTTLTVTYGFLGAMLNVKRRHVILDGCKGCGKSLIADNILQHLWNDRQWPVLSLHFSRNIKMRHVQDVIEQCHERRPYGFTAPPGKQVFIHIDDVNMPVPDAYGTQCSLEVLRQLIDREGFFDRQRWLFRSVMDTVLLLTPSPAAASDETVPRRLHRHCTALMVPPPSIEGAASIFTPVLRQFLGFARPDGTAFSRTVVQLHESLCYATAEIYQKVTNEIRPTPTHFFYAHSLYDQVKVVQGMLLAHPTVICNKTMATRLWAHEVLRVFGDRLQTEQHHLKFSGLLSTVLSIRFGTEWSPALESVPLRFSQLDFSAEDSSSGEADGPQDKEKVHYHELGRDETQIGQQLSDYLDEYNMTVKAPLSMLALVFFTDAVSHIVRVHRILLEPAGHIICLGLPGTGKRSLALFAAFLAESPAALPGYSELEVQRLLKEVLIGCGLRSERRVLLFTDNHFQQADVMADIVNTLLRSGDVGTAWSSGERDLICAKLLEPRSPLARKQQPVDRVNTASSDLGNYIQRTGTIKEEDDSGSATSAENMVEATLNRHMLWRRFLGQARKWLHLILCCSPAGTHLRNRCRCYPGLLGSCTVDLFTSWPEEALFAVSLHLFSDSIDPGIDTARKICDQVHLLTEATCEHYKVQQQRHVYICPQTYIEFLDLFLDKYREKAEEIEMKLKFLHAGQHKMEESKAAIAELSRDILRLQPKLQEHVDLTKALIEKLSKSKEEAQNKQRVLSQEREIFDNHAQAASETSAQAKAELARAEPMYRAAVAAVDNLDKRSIQELRVMLDPPPLCLLVLQCVCMLLGQPDDWAGARALLGDLSLIRRLKNFDKDNIPPKIAEKLKTYVNMPDFEPEEIGKQSKAAKEMSLWCCALFEYYEMKCALDEKVAHMRGLDRELDVMKDILNSKEAEYGNITDQISDFERRHKEAEASLTQLHTDIDSCHARRARATELMEAMKDEAKRWGEKEKKLEAELKTLPGDVVLSAAFTAYMGPFTQEFRKDLISKWTELCMKEGVALSANLKFQSLYEEPTNIYDWQINGLPADTNSADSAILVMHSPKWPYIIDPQQQARTWLRKQEEKHHLKELKMSDQNILKTIRDCLRAGTPVMLDDCAEDFPTALDPVLMPIDVQADANMDDENEESGGESPKSPRLTAMKLMPRNASNVMRQQSPRNRSRRQSDATSPRSPAFGNIDAMLQEGMKFPRVSEKPSWSGIGRFHQEEKKQNSSADDDSKRDKRFSLGPSTENRFSLGPSTDNSTSTIGRQADKQSLGPDNERTRHSHSKVRFSVDTGDGPGNFEKRRSSVASNMRSSFHRLSVVSGGSRRSSVRCSIASTSRHSVFLGDDTIPVDASFRLYLLTSIANPHVNPRLSIMLNLVNFEINLEGLTSQLLCEVLKVEAPELEADHIHVLKDHTKDMKELEECEDLILSKLCDAQTVDLLDNQDLLVTIQTALRLRGQLHGKVQDEERREAKFSSTCEIYKSIAEHGALVYISVLAMGNINPLYVVPLSQVIRCFVTTTAEFKAHAEANDYEKWNFIETATGQQVCGLNDDYVEEIQIRVMLSVFKHASRSLFLQDRLAFSFVLCVNLSLHLKRMTTRHYDILMKGTDALLELSDDERKKAIKEMNKHGNVSRYTPDASIISSSNWEMVRALALLLPGTFVKLPADIISNITQWRERLPEARPGHRLMEAAKGALEEAAEEAAEDPQGPRGSSFQVRLRKSVVQEQFGVSLCAELPAPWNSLFIEPFEQLLLIRALLPERLMHGMAGYVHRFLGPRFVDASPVRLEDVYYKDADSRTPLLISLMPGADPTSTIMDLAKSVRLESRNLHMISMAHEQSSKAIQILYESVVDGSWVLLQNCHLAQKWLTPLVSFVVKIVNDSAFTVHRRFRLFITTQAFPGFPMALLQCTMKVAFERPRGVRSRLLLNASTLSSQEEWFTFKKGGAASRNRLQTTASGTMALQLAWRRLFYGLSLFHAVVSERSSFGSRGFTVPYAFDDADFVVAREVLRTVYRDLPQDSVGTAEVLAARIAGNISWPSLIYVMSDVVYGGRVDDDSDRRCVRCCLGKFLYKDLLICKSGGRDLKKPLLSPGGQRNLARRQAFRGQSQAAAEFGKEEFPSTIQKKYKLPPFAKAETVSKTYEIVLKAVQALPEEEPPELFGLSSQAEVLLQESRSRDLLGKLQVIHFHRESSQAQIELESFGAGMQDDTVFSQLRHLRDELPPLQEHHYPLTRARSYQESAEKSSQDDNGSLTKSPQFLFLQHEKDCALDSLRLVHASLTELEEALSGHIPMNNHLESIRLAVLRNYVPSLWHGKRWEAKRLLTCWIKSLSARVKYFRSWNRKFETPLCFLINSFYNPRGFLTTVLQQEARRRAKSVDVLSFQHRVCTAYEEPADIQEAPQFGVYIFGMWIQGASWDTKQNVIADLRSHNQSCCLMPVIHFIPEVDRKPNFDVIYRAPCYQTTSGYGQADTTGQGQSSNLITVVELPIESDDGSDKWVLRGVALICQPDVE